MIELILAMCSSAASTWNPNDKTSGVSLSADHLTATASSTKDAIRGLESRAGGKFYFEVTPGTGIQWLIGIASSSWLFTNYMGKEDANSGSYYSGGDLYVNNGAVVAASSYGSGDVISVAVDISNHLVYFAKNGVWQNSANPASGTGGGNYITTSPIFPAFQSGFNSDIATLNTGGPFSYSIPSGFGPWD